MSEPEACSSDIGRAQISDERIARRTANAFANAINEPGDHQPLYGGGEGEDRLREGSQAVTERGKKLPAAKPVTESAGEHFHDEGCRFSDTFDDANGECRGAECHYEIERQKGVDHLRRDVHEHRDEAKRPDPCWDRAHALGGERLLSHAARLALVAHVRLAVPRPARLRGASTARP